jgi:hypothetical protein
MYAGRIYADFQNLDGENRIRLTSAGTRADLQESGVGLQEGITIALYTDDADDEGRADPLLADAIVEFSHADDCWVARVIWDDLRHASDSAVAENGAMNGARPNHQRDNQSRTTG